MKKTLIQIPKELFQELQTFAYQREWSLAETFRRGEESETSNKAPLAWTPPTSNRVGWKGLSADEFHDAVFDDGDPRLA